MSEFEDHLWREFVREHGDDLAQMSRPAARHNRWARPGAVAGAGLGLAGAGTALVLGTTTTSPAFAVTRNHDGTIIVSVTGYSGVAGANAKLRQLGIRAQVMTPVPPNCNAAVARQGAPVSSQKVAKAHWTINPRNIPAGRMLVLTPGPDRNSDSGGQVWSCRPATALARQAAGSGANS
jgi:hypothetical protein